jgi:putative pyruvate formate lyase activating enzyme
MSWPCYLNLFETGELERRVSQAYQFLDSCNLCGWECKKNRRQGSLGVCRTGELAKVSSYGAHMGEEDPLRGWRGSGTVFFTRCNLRCQYCQNYGISQADSGTDMQPENLAAIFLELQTGGCHNINLVSPTHIVPQILAAILIAVQAGLQLPIVYNTGGYDSLTALKLLDGVIDIYMPDMKYANPQVGLHYSKIRNYPSINQLAVKEMHRQVGDLETDPRGLARRGLLVRHLVLPNRLAGTQEIVRFLAEEISPNTYLNLMDQYHPEYLAKQYPRIDRRISQDEWTEAVSLAHQYGLHRLDHVR